MTFSYGDLTVRGRDGRHVAITDCKLEPLNLLIPGNAPIVVPKKHAWRSPSQQTNIAVNRSNKLHVEVAPRDDYEADSEEGDLDDDTQPLIKNSRPKGKTKSRCRKDAILEEKAREAKHLRKAERHQKRAELEREVAAGEHERLQKRIAKQEAYILRLKRRYENAGKKAQDSTSIKKSKSKKEASKKQTTKAADSDEGGTTDGSAAVREMLANIKIRAGGKENPRFVSQPGELPWNVSDDSQLIALKNDSSNSYAVVGECMGRGAGEVKRRYKYLKACDFKIPGGDETTEGEKTGEETTDAEQTGGETTDAEETDEDGKDGAVDATDPDKPQNENNGDDDDWTEETDTQLWKLKGDDKTWAEIQATMGKSKNCLRDRYKHLKSIDFKVPDETSDAEKAIVADAAADDFMTMASASVEKQMNEPAKKTSSLRSRKSSNSNKTSHAPSCFGGTNAYIAQYSRNLLAEANAGRTRIPEPDEIFDEDDCILLALADSRRRENRWLDIQADYFNVTGRMVPQEVLKWKLCRGERPEDVDYEEEEEEEDC